MTLNPLSTIKLATLIRRGNDEQTWMMGGGRSSAVVLNEKNMKEHIRRWAVQNCCFLKSQTLNEKHDELFFGFFVFFSRNWIENIVIFNIGFFFLLYMCTLFYFVFFFSWGDFSVQFQWRGLGGGGEQKWLVNSLFWLPSFFSQNPLL